MVLACAMDSYQTLDSTFPLDDSDHRYWWQVTGRPLALLLQHAGYDSGAQYRYLIFYREFILPALGPSHHTHSLPKWQSFMTDNGTPIELSLCWNEKGNRSVKFSIEPIGKEAGSSSDPVNLQQISTFMESMSSLQSSKHDVEWFRALEDGLFEHRSILCPRRRSRTNQVEEITGLLQNQSRIQSQYFTAIDLMEDHAIVKAYLIPELESRRTGLSKLELADRAMDKIGRPIAQSWSVVQDYLASLRQDGPLAPEIEILSVDCLKPSESRIKIYVRLRETSFKSVKDFITLGGRIKAHVTEDTLTILSQLWRRVMDVRPSNTDANWEEQQLPTVNHRTAGILYYFEMRPNRPIPWPKVYLPVRHYCKNDGVVASGIEDFMAMHQNIFGDWSEHGKYTHTLRDVFKIDDLKDHKGLHTYVTFAVKPAGWELHSYFNPGWRRETD